MSVNLSMIYYFLLAFLYFANLNIYYLILFLFLLSCFCIIIVFFFNYCVDQLQNYNLRQNHVIIVLKVLNKIIWCTGYALQNSKQIVLNCLWFGSGGFHLVFMA